MRKKEPKTLYISDILKEFKSLSYDGSNNTPQPLSKEMAGRIFKSLYGIALCEIRGELQKHTGGIEGIDPIEACYRRKKVISLSGDQICLISKMIEDKRDELIEKAVNGLLKGYEEIDIS